MEVTADPSRVSDNLRLSLGQFRFENDRTEPTECTARTAEETRAASPSTKMSFFPCLSWMFPTSWLFFFFPFPTYGVLITGSILRGPLNWNDRGVLHCSQVGSAAVWGNWKAGFPSWNQWERRGLCSCHCWLHNNKCLSSLSMIVLAGSNVTKTVTSVDEVTVWILWSSNKQPTNPSPHEDAFIFNSVNPTYIYHW